MLLLLLMPKMPVYPFTLGHKFQECKPLHRLSSSSTSSSLETFLWRTLNPMFWVIATSLPWYWTTKEFLGVTGLTLMEKLHLPMLQRVNLHSYHWSHYNSTWYKVHDPSSIATPRTCAMEHSNIFIVCLVSDWIPRRKPLSLSHHCEENENRNTL
jgi:hypothetical protein